MATTCDDLTNDLLADCNAKPVGGVEPLLMLIKKADYDAAVKTVDADNNLIVNSITLPTGKKAYKFEVFRRTHKPKFTNKDTDYGTYYLHEIPTAIQVWNNIIKSQITALSDDYYVAVVENVQKSGDAVFEIYGAGNGLRVQDGAIRDLGSNEGVYIATFGNDADTPEAKPPLSFVVETTNVFDYAATKAAFLALAVATP